MSGPYRAEFGAIHHEDAATFLFTVNPPSAADAVADAMNLAEAKPAPPAGALDREAVARIIDPLAFSEKYVRWTDPLWADKKAKRLAAAVAKADAILALSMTNASVGEP